MDCEPADAMEDSTGQQAGAPQGQVAREYHTALSGESLRTEFLGERVDVPAMDRGNVTALTFGATYYAPKQGDISRSPMGALYLKRTWESSRTRDIISILVNDLEYDESFERLELVMLFNNYTIPGSQAETIHNRKIISSSVQWGNLIASIGPGVRYRVSPFQVDNDVKLQLLGRAGYSYARRTADTDPHMVLPPDSMLYGAKLRGRYDGMRRNLLELPHEGFAAGFDLDYLHRDRRAESVSSSETISNPGTRDSLQYTG